MSTWFGTKGADAGQGFGTGVVTGATTALTNHAKDAFSSPDPLIVELSALLTTRIVQTAEGKTLAPEAHKRVETIITELKKKQDLYELTDEEEKTLNTLLSISNNPKELIDKASMLKDYVGQHWGDGWKFIFRQLSVLRAYLMSQEGDSLITNMTGKTVEALKVGVVGTPSPLLAEAHAALVRRDINAAKKALAALNERFKEAFSGKELKHEEKAVLERLAKHLEDPRDMDDAVKEGVALLEKYMFEIREAALIPTMVKSVFESLEKRIHEHDAEPPSGAIPPPAGAKKPLTYGAAFQGYVESILGFIGHAFDRQVALRYAKTLLAGLDFANRSTQGDGELKGLIDRAKASIQNSMAEIESAPAGMKIEDLVAKMTKDCRESLDGLQIYLNSFKLPIYTGESLEIPPEQLLHVEDLAAPAAAHATDELIEAARDQFIERTIAFVRNKFGRKPFDAFYIRGFTKKMMEFVNAYVEAHGDDRYFEKRKDVALYGDRFFRVLKNAIDEAKKSSEPFETALAKELLKPENNAGLTPNQIYDRFVDWAVDRFAPQHEWCKEMADAFKSVRLDPNSGLKFLNIPLAILMTGLNWVLAPFVFIGQMVANWTSPSILKSIARKTALLPTLIQTAEESMGFQTEYQYVKDKALYEQLSKLWKVIKRSREDGEEIVVSQEMRPKLQALASDLLTALDAHFKRLGTSATKYIPEGWIDTFAKGEAIEGLVKGLAIAMDKEFDRQTLKDQTLDTLTLLSACYDDSPAVSMDEKRKMERQLHELIEKIVYFSISKSIHDQMNPTATYQKEAARWVEALKADAQAMVADLDVGQPDAMRPKLVSFMQKQSDRLIELNANDRIDTPTRQMLGNIAGRGAIEIRALLANINAENLGKVTAWINGLKRVPFLNIKAFDTDPFIDIVTRIAYQRYKPLVEGLMQLTRQSSVLEGLLRQVVLLPVIQK